MGIWSRDGDMIVSHVGDHDVSIVKCERRRSYTSGMATISLIEKYYCISGCNKRFRKLRDAKRYAEESIIPTTIHGTS